MSNLTTVGDLIDKFIIKEASAMNRLGITYDNLEVAASVTRPNPGEAIVFGNSWGSIVQIQIPGTKKFRLYPSPNVKIAPTNPISTTNVDYTFN